MATRKIKDARDLSTNELIYFKGHAKATYMSDGSTVEDAINQIGTGEGTQGPQGPQGEQGPKGEDGATFTPSVDTDGNLSWTNDKGLSNPPTVNIKGPKGDSGGSGGGSSYAGNYPIVEDTLETFTDLEPNTYYVLESAGIGGGDNLTFNINLVTPSNFEIVNEYVFELHGIEGAISLPAYITWVNGDVPSFSVGKSYIISIVNYVAVYAEF